MDVNSSEMSIPDFKKVVVAGTVKTFLLASLILAASLESLAEDPKPRIAVIPKGTTQSFWKSVESGAKAAAKSLASRNLNRYYELDMEKTACEPGFAVHDKSFAGFLPYVNGLLVKAGSDKRFRNLVGVTLGTGFGGGIVIDGNLLLGDNSGAGEVWLLRHKTQRGFNVEEGISIRAVQRAYASYAGISNGEYVPTPKEICEIGQGQRTGKREAALQAYRVMAEARGDALATCVTLVDGLVVIGGGLSEAHPLFLQAVVDEMNSTFERPGGGTIPRLLVNVYNLEDARQREAFLKFESREVTVPGTGRKVSYDAVRRVGVGISKSGTSTMIATGAYAFALNRLENRSKTPLASLQTHP